MGVDGLPERWEVGCRWPSQVALVVKSQPAKAGDIRDAGSIPGLGRSPGGGHGHPLQYSCLKNPMDRRACGSTVHRIARVGHDLVTNTFTFHDFKLMVAEL